MKLFQGDQFHHLESSPRTFPGGQEIQSIGYIHSKREWIRKPFSTLNFSFILSGKGYYSDNGTLRVVQAPMVITQSPGIPMNYGPEGEWEELFLIFPASCYPWFVQRGFLGTSLWRMNNEGEIIAQIRELYHLIDRREGSALPDQIDLAVQKLILESRLEPATPRETPLQVFIQSVHASIEKDCAGDYDFNAMAESAGFSPSSFRRSWEIFYTLPPGQLLIEYRMRTACRALAETDRPVKEIALELGYDDPLYFSKLFRKKRNESPGEYRKRTRDPYFGSNRSFP